MHFLGLRVPIFHLFLRKPELTVRVTMDDGVWTTDACATTVALPTQSSRANDTAIFMHTINVLG